MNLYKTFSIDDEKSKNYNNFSDYATDEILKIISMEKLRRINDKTVFIKDIFIEAIPSKQQFDIIFHRLDNDFVELTDILYDCGIDSNDNEKEIKLILDKLLKNLNLERKYLYENDYYYLHIPY